MSAATYFAPVAATTGQTVTLSMQRLWLTGQILAAGARLVVQHVFRSEEEKPLEVIYSFPLPRDAALRRFRITGDGFEAHSELKETEHALKDYEQGIARGELATLARQYGDGLVNLTVGNIRPKETVTVYLEILCGVELRDNSFRFRFPFTLAPGYHSRAKVAATADGEGEIELPADEFGDLILPRFHENASALHEVGFELKIVGQALNEIGSPSHMLRVKREGRLTTQVALAAEKDVPNRDLVLDAHFESIEPQILSGRDKNGVGRFVAIVPSTSFGVREAAPQRVVILLDRSGSMQGVPIQQARKAIEACLGLLSETDLFGLVAFNQQALKFQPVLVAGTREWRDKAREFLMSQKSGGGTELAAGVLEAAALLGNGGGDILILTDGQVLGTEKVLADARSAKARLHCLGIGSASQDRFLSLLARETGGVSRFVTPGERVDLPAVDLFASIGRPVASGLKAGKNIQPEPLSLVLSGTPVLLFGDEVGNGNNQIELNWDGGTMSLPVKFSESDIAETVWLLQGSRLITDWESRYPSTEATAPLERRKESRVALRLVELSRTYQLASREMSLVAVVTREGDRPGQLPETRVVSMGMPKDTAFTAYFAAQLQPGVYASNVRLTQPPSGSPGDFTRIFGKGRPRVLGSIHVPADLTSAPAPLSSPIHADSEVTRFFAKPEPVTSLGVPSDLKRTADDTLLELASQMDSDGGMAGKDIEARVIRTLIALLAFLSQGHTPGKGAFRLHAARLLAFLKSLRGLSTDRQKIVDAVIESTLLGRAPAGDWITLAQTPGNHWNDVQRT